MHSEADRERIGKTGLADIIIRADATRPVEVMDRLLEATGGDLADIVINNVNVPNTEMASILSVKDNGIIYFFSMATSFTKAALGAEGVGNGYTRGHAEISLNVLRENSLIREMFQNQYT